MHRSLTLHPDSRCDAVSGIDVRIARLPAGGLVLHYLVTGKIGDLHLPQIGACGRADDLWQDTCFEVFLRASPESPYYEFNFAPSGQWAAYRFDRYRSGMRDACGVSDPGIDIRAGPSSLELRASLTPGGLCELSDVAAWEAGLSAVVKETNGRKSWWALRHPPGKPDFHHPDCFEFAIACGARQGP